MKFTTLCTFAAFVASPLLVAAAPAADSPVKQLLTILADKKADHHDDKSAGALDRRWLWPWQEHDKHEQCKEQCKQRFHKKADKEKKRECFCACWEVYDRPDPEEDYDDKDGACDTGILND